MELERLLLAIAERQRLAGPAGSVRRRDGPKGSPRTVLHVVTEVERIGGLTSMMLRWVRGDRLRRHDPALTRQRSIVPKRILAAIAEASGHVDYPGEAAGGPFRVAACLQPLAKAADLVVLHVFGYDVTRMLAFADRNGLPSYTLSSFWLRVRSAAPQDSVR